jgi:hypothetical protein
VTDLIQFLFESFDLKALGGLAAVVVRVDDVDPSAEFRHFD